MLSVLNETGQSSFQWGDACRCRIGAALSHPMCGRYTSFLPAKAIGAVHPLPNLAPSWNVAPTHSAPVVRRCEHRLNSPKMCRLNFPQVI